MSPVPSPASHRRRRERFSQNARRRLLRALFDGTLQPGEHLHDHELTAWLGVSRTPVRSALENLAEVGLIEITANRHTRVAAPTAKSHAETVEVASTIYGAMARSMLATLTEAEVDELRGRIARTVEAVGGTGDGTDGGGAGTVGGISGNGAEDWSAGRLRALGEVAAFVAARCDNPILLAVAAELDLRLAFSFRALGVEVDTASLPGWGERLDAAAAERDGVGFESALMGFLGSCAPPSAA